MNIFSKSAVLLTFLVSTMSASALASEALYNKHQCGTCHGVAGDKPIMPKYPKVSAIGSVYCVDQIGYIKSGKRNSGLSAAMKALVTKVPDKDIAAICDYLSKVKRK